MQAKFRIVTENNSLGKTVLNNGEKKFMGVKAVKII